MRARPGALHASQEVVKADSTTTKEAITERTQRRTVNFDAEAAAAADMEKELAARRANFLGSKRGSTAQFFVQPEEEEPEELQPQPPKVEAPQGCRRRQQQQQRSPRRVAAAAAAAASLRRRMSTH